MTFQARRVAIYGFLILASTAAGATTLEAQDACSTFLPNSDGRPLFESQPPICMGSYWIRVETKHFGGLREFGATIAIETHPSAEAAANKLAGFNLSGARVSYGDGGFETMEDASAPDRRVPTPEEVKANRQRGRTGDALGTGYSLFFTCGPYIISVHANPSTGPAARKLVAELEDNFRSQKVCGSAGARAPAIAAPVALPAPLAPPPTVERADGGGTRYFDGQTAREIQSARASGSRYMVVIDRTWDPSQNCYLEERAWVSSVSASSDGRVGAVVGPSRTFCVKGGVLDQAAINQAEARLQNYRNQLAKALQTKARFEAYLKDPKYQAWATTEIAKIDTYIREYEKYIAQTEASLAASIPQ